VNFENAHKVTGRIFAARKKERKLVIRERIS